MLRSGAWRTFFRQRRALLRVHVHRNLNFLFHFVELRLVRVRALVELVLRVIFAQRALDLLVLQVLPLDGQKLHLWLVLLREG